MSKKNKENLESAYFYSEEPVTISEQVDRDEIDIKLAKDVDVEKLIEGDKDPMFVTAEAMNEFITGNRNHFDATILEDVKNQVLAKKPNLYQGHIKDEDESTRTPDPKVIWIGAGLKKIKGKQRLFTKGYVLPTARKLRTYLKKANASGKDFPVSVYGKAAIKYDPIKKINQVKKFVVQSIDWAREFNEGIQHKAGLMYLTSEMKQSDDISNISDDETMDYTKVTLKEIKDNKPEILEEVKTAEVERIAEMLKVEPKNLDKTIKEMVKANKEYEAKIKEFEIKASHRVAEMFVDAKVKKKAINQVVKTLVISEMGNLEDRSDEGVQAHVDKVLETEEVKTLLKEQKDSTIISPPREAGKSGGSGVIEIS